MLMNQLGFMVERDTKLLKELEFILKDKPYITIGELVSLGIFGSRHSARAAVKEGRISVFRISRLRFVVSRMELARFLQTCNLSTEKAPMKKIEALKEKSNV